MTAMSRLQILLRWCRPLRPEAKLRRGLPVPQHASPAAERSYVPAGAYPCRLRSSLTWHPQREGSFPRPSLSDRAAPRSSGPDERPLRNGIHVPHSIFLDARHWGKAAVVVVHGLVVCFRECLLVVRHPG